MLSIRKCTRLMSTGAVMDGPLAMYKLLVDKGKYRLDLQQLKAAEQLQTKYNSYLHMITQPSRRSGGGWFAARTSLMDTKGLYVHGGIGSGKTMLVDMLHDSLASKTDSIQRVHFHSFMQQVHQRRHVKQQPLDGYPRLLFIDEFQVTDIADAMILQQLFQSIIHQGTTLICTSNRHPRDLYKNGIQRASFMPCIQLIEQQCDIVNLDTGALDYRSLSAQSVASAADTGKVWFTDVKQFTQAYYSLLEQYDQASVSRTLTVWQRPFHVEQQNQKMKVAMFKFDDLFARTLSSSEYNMLTDNYRYLFISDVPQLNLDYLQGTKHVQLQVKRIIDRDQIRRFITFIDCAYEKHSVLIMQSKQVASVKHLMSQHLQAIDISTHKDAAHEEVFAMRRAHSRLTQMQSDEWIRAYHELVAGGDTE